MNPRKRVLGAMQDGASRLALHVPHDDAMRQAVVVSGAREVRRGPAGKAQARKGGVGSGERGDWNGRYAGGAGGEGRRGGAGASGGGGLAAPSEAAGGAGVEACAWACASALAW